MGAARERVQAERASEGGGRRPARPGWPWWPGRVNTAFGFAPGAVFTLLQKALCEAFPAAHPCPRKVSISQAGPVRLGVTLPAGRLGCRLVHRPQTLSSQPEGTQQDSGVWGDFF